MIVGRLFANCAVLMAMNSPSIILRYSVLSLRIKTRYLLCHFSAQ